MRFPELKKKQQRGSKPRCHLFTDGGRAEVAGRLSALVKPYGSVSKMHKWQPAGFDLTEEAQLDKPSFLIADDKREELKKWWFAKQGGSSPPSPNWDIASQCDIRSGRQSRSGLLLVEAKAHTGELKPDGKPNRNANCGSRLNHKRIGEAIEEANAGLKDVTSNQGWALSRDCCYQMANRFAWAWKLASIGIPVVLVYPAFLNAVEMSDQGDPFLGLADWTECVKAHAKGKVPEDAWEHECEMPDGTLFVPRIVAVHQSLTAARVSH